MDKKAQLLGFHIVGFLGLITEAIWAALSPFYESGVFIVTTPFICLLGTAYFVFYLKGAKWAHQKSLAMGIGAGTVTAMFLGDSSDAYGNLAGAMLLVEVAALTTCLGLIVFYFMPAVREHVGLPKRT